LPTYVKVNQGSAYSIVFKNQVCVGDGFMVFRDIYFRFYPACHDSRKGNGTHQVSNDRGDDGDEKIHDILLSLSEFIYLLSAMRYGIKNILIAFTILPRVNTESDDHFYVEIFPVLN
jgi:hypothetical protein